MPTDGWDPRQYNRFKTERQQPFFDLLALVQPAPRMRVLDLGCGTGELTRHLHDTLAAADTIGIDTSPAMLAPATPTEQCTFRRADIADYQPDHPLDLVFSNAALHWLPDHPILLARISQFLTAHGQLAIQLPANFDHPSHTVAALVAAEEPFAAALGGYQHRTSVLAPEAYSVHLAELGFREQHVRLQVYAAWLPSRDDVVTWVRGTLLTDYLTRLPPALAAQFIERYRARLLPLLANTQPYLFPFKRVLLWGRR